MTTLITITEWTMPAKQPLRFKVGDRVQLHSPSQDDIDLSMGGVGTILEVAQEGPIDYWVMWHPYDVKSIVFDEELERAEV